MRHGSRALALLVLTGTAHPGAGVAVKVEGLRSERGQVLACLTTNARAFPDCSKDPDSRKLAVKAKGSPEIDFGPVAAGSYAVSLLHDENGNGKADMTLMIPREGFGFSRDAPARFGPPSFARAAFPVTDAPVRQTIRMRYIF